MTDNTDQDVLEKIKRLLSSDPTLLIQSREECDWLISEIEKLRVMHKAAMDACRDLAKQRDELKATLERERKHHKFDKENPF